MRDADRVFLMHRTDAGGDPRLHGRASIGVGGHLNPVDDGDDALMAGLRREWSEELEADWEPDFRLIGLLNDDSNPVGAVHLGVVFSVEAAGRAVDVREHDKLVGRVRGARRGGGKPGTGSRRGRASWPMRWGSVAERAFRAGADILNPCSVVPSLP